MATLWSKAKEASSRDLNARASVKRTMSNRQQAAATIEKLQNELNESTVKHAEAVYWLQLELDTTRRAKEAVEDRMSELYRDVQELKYAQPQKKSRPVVPDAEYMEQQNKQMEKYEHILRIMNNQIALMRSSSDALVKSLKNEISDLMDEKVRAELHLMNKLSAIDKEKHELDEKLASAEAAANKATNESSILPSSPNRGDAVRPPQPPRRHKSIDDDDETNLLLNEDLKRLRAENQSLKEQVVAPKTDAQADLVRETMQALTIENKRLDSELVSERNISRERLVQWTEEKGRLEDEVETLRHNEIILSEERMKEMHAMREAATSSLDRVALLWDRADESIQNLEGCMMEVRSSRHHHQDVDQLLSVQETASLVHGQIRLSLMLIELKLRNNLACLECDQSVELSLPDNASNLSANLLRLQMEAMNAIKSAEGRVEEQMECLRSQSIEESLTLRELHESKVVDLRQMRIAQELLEGDLSNLQQNMGKARTGEAEMFVSQEALETLQDEVLQVVERVKEKNETIGRLTAEIEEHKVRERTLMEELKRHMNDQADRQLVEQQRIMQQNAQYEDSDNNSSEGASSEYEEKTVDGTIYEEKTVYDEE